LIKGRIEHNNLIRKMENKCKPYLLKSYFKIDGKWFYECGQVEYKQLEED